MPRRFVRPALRCWNQRPDAAANSGGALRLNSQWLWFGEVALRTVFWKRLLIGLIVWGVFAAAFFAIVYGNLLIARRLAPKYRPVEGVDVVEVVHEHRIAVGAAAPVWRRRSSCAVIVGSSAAGSWLMFARALDGVPFGVRDPIFHHDLSFYVFTLPAWQYVYGFLFVSLIVALVAVGGRAPSRSAASRSRGGGARGGRAARRRPAAGASGGAPRARARRPHPGGGGHAHASRRSSAPSSSSAAAG